MKSKGDTLKDEEVKFLTSLYSALVGVVSERGYDFFDSYYGEGGSVMMDKFEKLLSRLRPHYFAIKEILIAEGFDLDSLPSNV